MSSEQEIERTYEKLPAGYDQGGPFALYYGYHGVQREHPLREYAAMLFKHWLLILGLGLAGLSWGTIINRTSARVYQSSALINIGSYVPPQEGPTAELLRSETTREGYASSQIGLLKSYRIAKHVLATRPDLRSYLDHDAPTETEGTLKLHVDTLDQYLSMVSSTSMDDTSLLKINAVGPTPLIAAAIANAHAHAFIDIVREQLRSAASINLGYLQDRAKETAQKVLAKESQLKAFAADNLISLDDLGLAQVGEHSRTLLAALGQAVQERAGVEGELRELKNSSFGKEARVSAGMQPAFLRRNELESELQLLQRTKPDHPAIPSIEREIRSLKAAMQRSAKSEIIDSSIRLKAVEERERLLRTELEQTKKNEEQEHSKQLEYRLLEQEYQALKTVEKEAQARLEDALINAENDQQTVTMIDAAVPSNSPISPNERSNLMTGVMFGLLLGLSIAFLITVANNTVNTVSELKRLTNVSVLGVIPTFARRFRRAKPSIMNEERGGEPLSDNDSLARVREAGRKNSARHAETDEDETFGREAGPHQLVLIATPLSRESESFRHIRTTLKLSNESGAPKIILVTSGQKGDGKTTVAANLAVSFAQTGVKTLLIDADLRLPAVHRYFEQPRNCLGLKDFLAGDSPAEALITESGVTGLDLLLAGGSTSTPAELLGGQNMIELLQRVGDVYDQIIIDTPPVAHVTDALLLSPLANAVVLVVRSAQTPKPVAEFAVHRLAQVKANVVGTVLNDVKRTAAYREPEYYFVSGDYYYR